MQRCGVRRWVQAVVVVAPVILLAAPLALAQEVCGLQSAVYDVIFANGFQPGSGTLGNPLGTVSSPTIGVTPTVTITYPTANALLSTNHTAVAGTFTGPSHVGIVVNGQTAYTFNNSFLVPDVSLISSDPTLHLTATTLDELNASTSTSVQLPAQAPLARLDADASVGIAPFNIDFLLTTDPSLQVQGISINYGDGGTFSGGGTAAIPGHTYATPGIYVVSATLTTMSGSVSADHRVIILDIQELRNRLCGVYAYLRVQLAAQDQTHALQAYDPLDRVRYQSFFTAVGQAQLPALASELGTLAAGMVGPREAHLTVAKTISGVVQGYLIELAPDENGVWRIRQM